jgi:phosphoglycolate phosphatase-like HAD superfamily hydrolase
MAKKGLRSLKDSFPSLEEWKTELEAFGSEAEKAEMEKAEPRTLSLTEVRSVMKEIYYGAEYKGEAVYGIAGEGYWRKERLGTSRHWTDFPLPVGIYTGRSRSEMALAQKLLNWTDFPENMRITSDDGILKPSPLGLSELCQRSGAKVPLFFGDTASDKETWRAFGEGVFVAIGPILKAEAAKEGIPHYDTLEAALSELIYPL